MFDMRNLITRYFEVTLPNGTYLEVEPPKIKVLKRMMEVAKMEEADALDDTALDGLIEALSLALSKNKQRQEVPPKMISDMLDFDQIQALMIAYFEWVAEIQGSKN